MNNIPVVKVGIVAVSRDCFPESLSVNRRRALVEAYKKQYEAEDIYGPEISETLLAKYFDGPKMFLAAAEETQNNLIDGRGDAYCGMLNASYNLKLRNKKEYIPEYPV